jgi:hypothetical protein
MNGFYILKKLIAVLFVVGMTAGSSVYAKAERSSVLCEPRIPAIDLNAATMIVIKNHTASGLSDKKIFFDEATLECSDQKYYWKIGYRLQAYESGHFYAEVSMDGAVNEGPVVKDR